jgi:ribonuclease HI
MFCNGDVEEGAHLFIKCDHVKEAWLKLGLEDIRRELATSRSEMHALDIVWAKPLEERVQILTLWWLWWCNRNRLREGEKTLDATCIAHQTICSAGEYLQCLGKKATDRSVSQSCWLPPVQDVLKFNLDGAYIAENNHSGWGVIARDHRGEVVVAGAGRSEHIADAFHAELNAAVQAVRLADSLGAIRIVLETDSQLLVLALNRNEADSSRLGVIIDDLKMQLRLSFSSFEINFCKREFNRAAHELARLGYSNDVNRAMLWELEVPASIAGIVSGEMP